MSGDLHVVLGGSGSVGRALTEELIGRGRTVRSVTRTEHHDPPESAEHLMADVSVSAGAETACAGASVVYNCIFPPVNHAVTSACARSGAKLVLTDGLSVYDCSSGPMSETTRYEFMGRETGALRYELEHRLMTAQNRGDLRAVIARSSDLFGPGVIVSVMGSAVFRAALDGRAATVLGDPSLPHTYTFSRDFARAIAVLGEREEADGKIWHVPSAETVSTRDFLEIVYERAGRRPKLRALGPAALTVMGLFSGMVRQARREKLYQFQAPFVSDHSAFEAAFGADVTPHDEAIDETLEWFRNY